MTENGLLWEQYEAMVEGLESGKIAPEKPFSEICAGLGADEAQMAELIFSETGMTGEEVLNLYRN